MKEEMINMCVIAYAEKGVKIPNSELMETMFNGNSDGAGFAYSLNEKVYIEKGFMSYREFDNAVAGTEKRIKAKFGVSMEDLPIMFHFRIGTHGANSPQLTHPFPITRQTKYLQGLDVVTDLAIAHNGIIHSVTAKNDHSDTTQYIKDILQPLKATNKYFYNNKNIQRLMENTIDGSRFVFLNKLGEFTTIGNWKTSEEAPGVMFSNLNHEFSYSYSYPSTFNGHWSGRADFFDYEIDAMPLEKGMYLTSWENINVDNSIKDLNKMMPAFGKNTYMSYYVDVYTKDIVSVPNGDRTTTSAWFSSMYDLVCTIDSEGLIELVAVEDYQGKPEKMMVRDYWYDTQ